MRISKYETNSKSEYQKFKTSLGLLEEGLKHQIRNANVEIRNKLKIIITKIQDRDIHCEGSGERNRGFTQKKVKMVRNQGPSVALGLGFIKDNGEPFQERRAVLIIQEDLSSFNSPGHDVLEEARGVKSWLAWHFFRQDSQDYWDFFVFKSLCERVGALAGCEVIFTYIESSCYDPF